MRTTLEILERFVELCDSAYPENEFNITELMELKADAKIAAENLLAQYPRVDVLTGIFAGESGKLVNVVTSHPSGESLSQPVYFVRLRDGEVAFYKSELKIYTV